MSETELKECYLTNVCNAHTKLQRLSALSFPRCGRSDLHDQQVPHCQTDNQGPVHYRLRWPARCHRLLPWLPVEKGTLPPERDVPHRHHHRHLLHGLRSGTSTKFIMFWSKWKTCRSAWFALLWPPTNLIMGCYFYNYQCATSVFVKLNAQSVARKI